MKYADTNMRAFVDGEDVSTGPGIMFPQFEKAIIRCTVSEEEDTAAQELSADWDMPVLVGGGKSGVKEPVVLDYLMHTLVTQAAIVAPSPLYTHGGDLKSLAVGEYELLLLPTMKDGERLPLGTSFAIGKGAHQQAGKFVGSSPDWKSDFIHRCAGVGVTISISESVLLSVDGVSAKVVELESSDLDVETTSEE